MLSRRGLAACNRCGTAIRWTVTDAGRSLAVDPQPDEDGNTAVHRDDRGVWRSRRPTNEIPLRPWERIYMPHPATCPRRAATPTNLPTHTTRRTP